MARTQLKSGEATFPGIAAMRSKLNEEVAKIEAAKLPKMMPIRNKHIERLQGLRAALIESGNLESAKEVTEEMKQLAATKLQAPERRPAEPAPRAELTEISNSPLHSTERQVGEFSLKPGRYVLEDQAQAHIGNREIQGPAGVGHMVLPGPSQVEGGVIFVNRGSFKATGTRFVESRLQANLGGRWEVAGCLFDGCRLNKAGAWFTRYYSSKWVIDDCVFAENFVLRLHHTPVGIQATNCTILGATLPPVKFFEDAGQEALHEWRKVENCHFIGCEIPHSFLLITQGCLFEDCVFVPDDEPVKNLTSLKATIYVKPASQPRIAGNQWTVDVRPAAELSSQPGSSTAYVYEDGELNFR